MRGSKSLGVAEGSGRSTRSWSAEGTAGQGRRAGWPASKDRFDDDGQQEDDAADKQGMGSHMQLCIGT